MKLKKVMAILSVATMLAGGFASFAELIQPNVTVKAAARNKKHKFTWIKGVPKALRGKYQTKAKRDGFFWESRAALNMRSKQFVEWSPGVPIQFTYHVRYRKTGRNKYTFLYKVYKYYTILGGYTDKMIITKIDKNHFKIEGGDQIYHKVKNSKFYLKGVTTLKKYLGN